MTSSGDDPAPLAHAGRFSQSLSGRVAADSTFPLSLPAPLPRGSELQVAGAGSISRGFPQLFEPAGHQCDTVCHPFDGTLRGDTRHQKRRRNSFGRRYCIRPARRVSAGTPNLLRGYVKLPLCGRLMATGFSGQRPEVAHAMARRSRHPATTVHDLRDRSGAAGAGLWRTGPRRTDQHH